MSEKEMIKRYIYEVTKRVPQEMRRDIELELQSLIEDMCRDEDITVEEVLQKLGNPEEFAKRYKDTPNYLIGPEYYDNYIWVLKMAIIGISISILVSAIVNGITEADKFGSFLANFITNVILNAGTGICSAFGMVTIIFGVLEWKKVKVSIKPENKWTVGDLSKNATVIKSWTPNSLPPIPDKRAVITRGDSVCSIIFIMVFATLLMFAPNLFGGFHYEDGELINFACVFNLEQWGRIVPLMLFSLFIGLIDEIVRLVTGYYCKPVMYSSIICGVIQIICAVILLKFLPLWNMEFVNEILEYTGKIQFGSNDILRIWGSDIFNNYILMFITFITCIEIAAAVYKTIRYSN